MGSTIRNRAEGRSKTGVAWRRALALGAFALVFGTALVAFALTRGIISDHPAIQTDPATDGEYAVWVDERGEDADVWGRDLGGGDERAIAEADGSQRAPRVSGSIVVWEDERADPGGGSFDIYSYDLSTDSERAIAVGPSQQLEPDVSGTRVVWRDDRNGDSDIYLLDLATGIESAVSTAPGEQTSPAISGTRVVWVDRRSPTPQIYTRDMATADPATPVAASPNEQWSPDVDGSTVAWVERTSATGDNAVFVQELGAGPAQNVYESGSFIDDLSMSERLIAWHLDEAQGWVKGFDRSTEQTLDLAGGPRDFVGQPFVGGPVVVWADFGDEDRADIYGLTLELNDTTAPTTRVEGIDEDGRIPAGAPLELIAEDNGIFFSGVAQTLFVLDDGPETEYTEPILAELGQHTLRFWSVDASGNAEPSNEVSFEVVEASEEGSGVVQTSSLPATGGQGLTLVLLAAVFGVVGTAFRSISARD